MKNLRRFVSYVIGIGMIGLFFYGMYQYPDAPLHPCKEHDYCGKQGQPHTQKQFEEFKRWETTLMWSWPLGMLALFLLGDQKQSNLGNKHA